MRLQTNRFFTKSIIVCLLLTAVLTTQGQQVRTYDAEQLSSNQITSLCQDGQGYVWIGTEYGLNKYDGVFFRQYYNDEGNGQTCVISDDECGDGAAIRIDNLDFLPMQFPKTLDVSDYRFWHVEFWVSTDCQLDLTFQNWWPGEKFITPIYELKAGQWNVLDIDLDQEAFTWSKKNEIAQHCVNVFKLGGEAVNEDEHPYAQTIWMTNIVCHNDDSVLPAGINEIANTPQSADSQKYNLAGQRVSSGYKGLAIVNGRKVMIK